jgi:hypothetical protein
MRVAMTVMVIIAVIMAVMKVTDVTSNWVMTVAVKVMAISLNVTTK